MQYGNLSGKSGVVSYDLAPDSITVTFRGGRSYTYPESMNGTATIARMKQLAQAGRGLSTFIAQNRHSLSFV